MNVNDGDFGGSATGSAVHLLSDVLMQREKTKRLLIGAACLFFMVAALVIVFAPEAKQGLAYTLGGALIVMALGAIGVTRFKLKAPGISVETGAHSARAYEVNVPDRKNFTSQGEYMKEVHKIARKTGLRGGGNDIPA